MLCSGDLPQKVLHNAYLCSVTLDVQAVQATVIDKSAIEVQCLFIPGSDALGCHVVFESECSPVVDPYVNISRSTDTPVSKMLIIHQEVSCFQHVFAYDIDANDTISNLSVIGRVEPLVHNTHTSKICSPHANITF